MKIRAKVVKMKVIGKFSKIQIKCPIKSMIPLLNSKLSPNTSPNNNHNPNNNKPPHSNKQTSGDFTRE